MLPFVYHLTHLTQPVMAEDCEEPTSCTKAYST